MYVVIGDENVARLEDLLIKAQEAATDDVVRMRVAMLRLPIWHYRLMLAGRPEWMAGTYSEKNSTRRWYASTAEIKKTVAKLMETNDHAQTIRDYVDALDWGDVRGFRESPMLDWRDALRAAAR
jgi:hypothetical protein